MFSTVIGLIRFNSSRTYNHVITNQGSFGACWEKLKNYLDDETFPESYFNHLKTSETSGFSAFVTTVLFTAVFSGIGLF